MPFPSVCIGVRTMSLIMVVALFATGCGSSANDAAFSPTVEASVELPAPGSSDADNSGADNSGADNSGADNSGADNSGADNSGADNSGADNSGAGPSAVATAIEVAIPPAPLLTSAALSCLTQRQRLAQLLLPLATQRELFGARTFAADGELGGIGLLGQPDAAVADDLAALQLSSPVPIIVASDEEGGTVQRLGTLLGPIPSASSMAQQETPDEVRRDWVEYGNRVRALGVDVVFGPVLDVGSGPGIESRSFSDDPQVVAAFGRAVAEGLLEAGVMPVFKHFPGHGRATADSHLELPTTPGIDELRATDLIPYVEIMADPTMQMDAGVMVGHLSVPGLSGAVPTSLSPEAVTGLLRAELGFDGLIFTDAMNMGAIINSYGLLDALELAIVAGADVAILGSLADLTPALDHLVARAEADANFAAMIDSRAARVLAAKGQEQLCAGAG